jgi:23S rRNA (uracil1939-C5)-methyltransferase
MRGEDGLTAHRVRIGSLGTSGDGIADDGTYVPFAAPGDVLDIVAEGRRGTVEAIIEPSPRRIAPVCPHFGICGACQVQHVEPDTCRTWKRGLVVAALERAGIDAPVADLVDAHGLGRRRVTFTLRGGEAGYLRRASHDLMPVDVCPILAPNLATAIPFAKALAAVVRDKMLSVLVTATQMGLDADIKGPLHPNARLNAQLVGVANLHNIARLTAEREAVALMRTPTITIGPVATLTLPPGAFLQATLRAEEILAHLACDVFRRARRVVDLFCGVGPFAIRLAAWSRVAAFDADGLAVSALRRAAAVPGFKPVTAERRDLYRRPLAASELEPFDAAVLDPPFEGAAAQVAELARSSVPQVRYVSCNPVTFARDAKTLIDGGYSLVAVTPVDQFLYSAHVELVGAFER